MWGLWEPLLAHYLFLKVLYWGPQLVRVFMRLHSVPMPCLLSVARGAFTILYCLGVYRLCYVGMPSYTFWPLAFHRRRRKPLGPSSELGANFVAGSLVGWPLWLALGSGKRRV